MTARISFAVSALALLGFYGTCVAQEIDEPATEPGTEVSATAPADDDADAPVLPGAQAPRPVTKEPQVSERRPWMPNVRLQGAFSYGYDFNEPAQNTTNAQEGVYSGVDKADAFNVDLLQLAVNGTFPMGGYSLKVDTGDLARVVGDSGNANRSILLYRGGGQWEFAVQDLFVYVQPGPVTFTLGRFPSPIGYEVVEPWKNPNITRSRAWYEQPISYDGVVIAGSLYRVDLLAAYVNSYFRDNEYDPFKQQTDFRRLIDHSSAESGFVFKVETQFLETDLSFAGFYGKTDQARFFNRSAPGSAQFLLVGEDPTDTLLLNIVAAHTFGIVNLAGEFNYSDTEDFDGRFFDLTNDLNGASGCGSNCGGDVVNGTFYLGVPFLERGSIDLRGDYGSYDTPIRLKDTDQWSITSTAGWRFNDFINLRFEYRYDHADQKESGQDEVFDDHKETDSSVHTLQLQLVLSADSSLLMRE